MIEIQYIIHPHRSAFWGPGVGGWEGGACALERHEGVDLDWEAVSSSKELSFYFQWIRNKREGLGK